MLIQIRIRIDIKTMTIHMRNLTILNNRWKNPFTYSNASLQRFFFLIDGKGVMIITIFDSILKFSVKSKNTCAWNRYRSGKMMQIRPDPDPEQKKMFSDIKIFKFIDDSIICSKVVPDLLLLQRKGRSNKPVADFPLSVPRLCKMGEVPGQLTHSPPHLYNTNPM
jgi:hypothetical protein